LKAGCTVTLWVKSTRITEKSRDTVWQNVKSGKLDKYQIVKGQLQTLENNTVIEYTIHKNFPHVGKKF